MNIGYVYYLVIILLVSGYLIIRIDSRFYEKEQMDKEKKWLSF